LIGFNPHWDYAQPKDKFKIALETNLVHELVHVRDYQTHTYDEDPSEIRASQMENIYGASLGLPMRGTYYRYHIDSMTKKEIETTLVVPKL